MRYSYEEFIEIAEALVFLLTNHNLQRPFFATITTKKIRISQI